MKFTTSVALSLLPLLSAALPTTSETQQAPIGAPVSTTSGTYVGHAAPGVSGVSEYLGIRYAQSTAPPRRFQAPVAFNSSGDFEAIAFVGFACPYSAAPNVTGFPGLLPPFQHIYDAFEGTQSGLKQMSEDCLSINVWTPNPSPTANLPVVVFIYGGRFSSGSDNSSFYVGQNVASSGEVVFVNLNYRVGIFGFSGAPGMTQNIGLLDQRLALEWVKSNIQQFGGDPTKILIVGQSVGGLSVDYHTYAWPEDPIAHAVMSISGTAASAQPLNASIMEQNWFTAARAVDCPTSGDAVHCMQNQTFQELLVAVSKVPALPSKALAQPVFQETIVEVVVFSDYPQRGEAGQFAKIPYLLGNLDNEAGFYKLLAFISKVNLTNTQWDDFNLQAFTCATSIEAANRVNNGVTAYRYRGFFDFEDLRIYPTSGAYHGSDLNMWFSNAPLQAQAPNTQVEQASTVYMTNALIAFATDPENGLLDFGWLKYTVDGAATLVRVGYNNETTASFVSPAVFDGPCVGFDGDTSLGMGAM
ncbi:hypothetical protein B7463_g6057, partial [Scytalidium lignicola]